jgi:hypothetical protein
MPGDFESDRDEDDTDKDILFLNVKKFDSLKIKMADNFYFSKTNKEYAHIQSSVSSRANTSDKITKTLKLGFNPNNTCTQNWDDLLVINKTQSISHNAGEHGKFFGNYLKGYPDVPVGIKQTNELELFEVKQTLLTGALVEVGANPHFNMLYAHLHCEDKNTPKFLADKPNLVAWKEGLKQVEQLNARIKSTTNTNEVKMLEEERNRIFMNLYPSTEDVNRIRQLKMEKERQFDETYATVSPEERTDEVSKNDIMLMASLQSTYDHMQQIRSRYHSAYELIFMEYATGEFDEWIDKNPRPEQLISATFQMCVGFLSYMAFFKSVQNDMLLHNVMYNYVDPGVFYVYKIGSLYLKVPLHGHLFKLIDFGLATTVKNFYKPTEQGKVATHWCPGGRGSKNQPNDKLQCSVYVRDILELFYNLSIHNTLSDDTGVSLAVKFDNRVRDWVKYAHKEAQKITNDHISSPINLIINIFSSETLKKFQLPPVIQMSTTPIPVQPMYQREPFEVVNRKKYIKAINERVAAKFWQA